MAASFPVLVPITALDRFSGVLEKMGGAAGRWGQRVAKVGRTLTVSLTVPTVALGVASARTGITFNRTLNEIEASSSATAEEMAALREQAMGLSGTTHTLTQVAEAMASLAREGDGVANAQALLAPALRFATIRGGEQADAIAGLTDLMDVLGIETADAAGFVDLLAKASRRTNLGQLAEGLQAAGPRARATGQDLAQIISLLDKLEEVGFGGAKGGAAVTAALSAMVKPGRLARRELELLGINRSDLQRADGTLLDIASLLELLAERGATTTQVLRIFGEGGDAMARLLQQNLTPAVRAGAAEFKDLDGEAQRVVDTLTKGGVQAGTKLADAWERVGVTIAESGLLDALTEGVELVGSLARRFQQLSPETRRWLLIAGGIAAVVGPALVVLGSLVTTVTGLVGAVSTVAPMIGGAATAVAAAAAPVAAAALPWIVLAAGIGKIAYDLSNLIDVARGVNQERAGPPIVERPAVDSMQFAHLQGAPAGPALDALAAAAPGAPGSSSDGAQGKVVVDFKNVPKGTRIALDPIADGLEILAGYNLATDL